jgi:hypothetical protein
VLFFAASVALLSALPYAGGWNDGSRLATVESLVDYHTLSINRSIFVTTDRWPGSFPYPPGDQRVRNGTGDKLLIEGRYYSDKSPVPELLMAAVYKVMQMAVGLKARDQPRLFCYLMTIASSGLAYVIAVVCIFHLCEILGLSLFQSTALTLSFALGTTALPYVREVNNHIMLLAVAAALMLAFAHLQRETGSRLSRAVAIGTLAGLGYTIDLGVGPPLLVAASVLFLYRRPNLSAMGLFLLGALPWVCLHHIVNYRIGGTIGPANAVPAYLNYPGNNFSGHMTGVLAHKSIGHFFTYAFSLLLGKRGFLNHNLLLMMALPGVVILLRNRIRETPEVLFAACWSGATWLTYATLSNNYSGWCCSIRWFVPLLAPGYYVLAVLLRDHPRYWPDFWILNAWGLLLGVLMWWRGPWAGLMPPLFWEIQICALLSWGSYRIYAARQPNSAVSVSTPFSSSA